MHMSWLAGKSKDQIDHIFLYFPYSNIIVLNESVTPDMNILKASEDSIISLI